MSRRFKKYFIILWLLFLLGVTGGLFWYNEYRYTLPTPVPVNYHAVKNGIRIPAGDFIPNRTHKPLLLHFFNPDCPCSRFNITHVKQLLTDYGNRVQIVIVVVSSRPFDAEKIRRKFGLSVPVIQDKGLSTMCGVYSTPQAVILTGENSLYFRGNYNRSRYCTDEQTAYARQALSDVLENRPNSSTALYALRAYGCALTR